MPSVLKMNGSGGVVSPDARPGSLPVGALLGHLRRAGLVRGGESVASVEMGNAIMGGAGTTWVHRFEVCVDG
jgi:hypothetical protein